MTEAEEVANRYKSEGANRWSDNEGIMLIDVLRKEAHANRPDEQGNITWKFKDGSAIIVRGDSWRLE